jgi:putative tricarboxylic transport membrane protein
MTSRTAPDLTGAAVALAFAALGGFAVVESLGMTTLGAIFPRTVGGVLIGLSLVQFGLALTGRGGQSSGEGSDTGHEGMERRIALIVVMIAWALLFPVIGFVVTSVVAGIALLFIAEHERPSPLGRLVRIAAVIAMVAAFYWLMVVVLFIPMPRALLF